MHAGLGSPSLSMSNKLIGLRFKICVSLTILELSLLLCLVLWHLACPVQSHTTQLVVPYVYLVLNSSHFFSYSRGDAISLELRELERLSIGCALNYT